MAYERKDMNDEQIDGADIQTSPSPTEDALHSNDTSFLKHNAKGLLLVPQPSDDPRDPLNWSTTKKLVTLGIVCLSAFSVLLQLLCNTSGYFTQALLYHKSPVAISYGGSAGLGGIVVGPLVWTPLARRFGKASMTFWSMVLALAVNAWSASMTKPDQYTVFVVSRLFAGLFGSAPLSIGAGFIIDVFFLHDRGKCFALYTCSILAGGIMTTTYSGYIDNKASWTVQFWYNVGLLGVIALLCLGFLDETIWSRKGQPPVPYPPSGFVQRKLATYFFTKRLTPKAPKGATIRDITYPILIGLNPVGILMGITIMVAFGWGIAINIFLSIFLQNPLDKGGYALTPGENASFTFTLWIAFAVAELYGHLLGDRIPLYLCARNGGVWKPEFRLHSTWFTYLFCVPLGNGLFGACLHYHWSLGALAFATFLTQFGAIAAFPAILNYAIEAFTPSLASETTASLNIYRSALAIPLSFFLTPWTIAVGTNWAFGMMAFFTILAYGCIVACMIWGPKIRAMSFIRVESEAGIHVVEGGAKTKEAAV